jgi:membrane protein DedA with SNARE-associated domain
MDAYIEQAGLFIQTNQDWAGLIIFLLTLGESLLIVGILIPATALLLLTGGLIGTGTLSAWNILIWGIAGAIVGDAISYFIGRWLGFGILRRWPFNTQRTSVARARLFFYRYGFISVLIGRFLGPIRSTIPTVAGMMGMKHWLFQLANVLSALLWLPAMLAPGYLTAKGVDAAQGSSHSGLIYGAVASVLIGVGLVALFIRKRKPERRARPSRQ